MVMASRVDESAKVHENFEIVTDPATGEQTQSVLPSTLHDTMTQRIADYRGFALELDPTSPWLMFASRVVGLALLVATLGGGRSGQYLATSLALGDLNMVLGSNKPDGMSSKDLLRVRVAIAAGAIGLYVLGRRQAGVVFM